MRGLPFDLRFSVGGAEVHLVHGSPRKVNEYLFEDKPGAAYMRRLAASELRRGRSCSATHTSRGVREHGGRAVRQLRLCRQAQGRRPRRAAFAVLTVSAWGVEATIERVDYDADARSPPRSARRDSPASTPTSWCSRHDRRAPPLRAACSPSCSGRRFLAATGDRLGDRGAGRFSPGDVGLELLENAAATAAGLYAIILMFGPISGGHFKPRRLARRRRARRDSPARCASPTFPRAGRRLCPSARSSPTGCSR